MKNHFSIKKVLPFLAAFLQFMGNICLAQAYVTDTVAVYDFIPRGKVIFEDDFSDDKPGTFPHKWHVSVCNAIILSNNSAKVGKSDKDYEVEIDAINYNDHMLAPNVSGIYMEDSFTLEYDFLMSEPDDRVYFGFPGTQSSSNCVNQIIYLGQNLNRYLEIKVEGFAQTEADTYPKHYYHGAKISKDFDYASWHHFAISYYKHCIKCYLDNRRLETILDCGYTPATFFITCHGVVKFRNIKLATGKESSEMDILLNQKKFVTHAINFDANSATLKQESFSFISQLADWLRRNPNIILEIDGHTDNVGNATHNVKLSQDRADEVKNQLVKLGVSSIRLTTKGYGDTKPINSNTTLDGRAANRRVEFIKL